MATALRQWFLMNQFDLIGNHLLTEKSELWFSLRSVEVDYLLSYQPPPSMEHKGSQSKGSG
jgi:hypothetical protein